MNPDEERKTPRGRKPSDSISAAHRPISPKFRRKRDDKKEKDRKLIDLQHLVDNVMAENVSLRTENELLTKQVASLKDHNGKNDVESFAQENMELRKANESLYEKNLALQKTKIRLELELESVTSDNKAKTKSVNELSDLITQLRKQIETSRRREQVGKRSTSPVLHRPKPGEELFTEEKKKKKRWSRIEDHEVSRIRRKEDRISDWKKKKPFPSLDNVPTNVSNSQPSIHFNTSSFSTLSASCQTVSFGPSHSSSPPNSPTQTIDHTMQFQPLERSCRAISFWRLKQWKRKQNEIEVCFSGPEETEKGEGHHLIDRASACSVSTYPWMRKTRPIRDGTPICDAYSFKTVSNGPIIAVMTDGCNWGDRPLNSSRLANRTFGQYMLEHSGKFFSTRSLGKYLLRALAGAHAAIMKGHDSLRNPAGTTTIIGGFLAKKERRSLVAISDEILRFLRRNKDGTSHLESIFQKAFQTPAYSQWVDILIDLLSEILSSVVDLLNSNESADVRLGGYQAAVSKLSLRLDTGVLREKSVCALENDFRECSAAEDLVRLTKTASMDLEMLVLLWGEAIGDDTVTQILMCDTHQNSPQGNCSTIPPKIEEQKDLSQMDESALKKLKLRDVFADPTLSRIFSNYIKQGMATENLMFWTNAFEFRSLQDEKAKREKVNQIWEMFFDDSSEYAFLLTGAERELLDNYRLGDHLPQNMFECVESRVYLELSNNLRGFVSSGKFFEAISAEVEEERKKEQAKEQVKEKKKQTKSRTFSLSEVPRTRSKKITKKLEEKKEALDLPGLPGQSSVPLGRPLTGSQVTTPPSVVFQNTSPTHSHSLPSHSSRVTSPISSPRKLKVGSPTIPGYSNTIPQGLRPFQDSPPLPPPIPSLPPLPSLPPPPPPSITEFSDQNCDSEEDLQLDDEGKGYKSFTSPCVNRAAPFSKGGSPSVPTTSEYVFVCAGVGDCKGYAYLCKDRKVVDFTSGSRSHSKDPTDPGGRIGPCMGASPDLRNYDCCSVELTQGDLVLLVSDGIHDNLDPEYLGKSPSDCGLSFDTWAPKEKEEEVLRKKVAFSENLLLELIREGLDEDEDPVPQEVTRKLIVHSKSTTKPAREWLELNENRRLPQDYSLFPGKMDHASCLCFVVSHDELLHPYVLPDDYVDSEEEEERKEESEKEEEKNEKEEEKNEKEEEKNEKESAEEEASADEEEEKEGEKEKEEEEGNGDGKELN